MTHLLSIILATLIISMNSMAASSFDKLNSDGITELTLAVRKCDLSQVSKLLSNGANANAKNRDGTTPLMWVGFFYNPPESTKLAIAKLLVTHGANISEVDNYGHSVLEHQVPYNLNEVIAYLVSQGAKDQDGPPPSKSSALLSAIEGQKIKIVETLLKNGIDPNRERIIWAVMHYSNPIIQEQILASNKLDKKSPRWVQMAAIESQIDMLKKLIKLGAELNTPTEGNKSALILAIENDKTDVAKILIEAHVNTETKTKSGFGSLLGETAICIATRKNNLEIVQELIRAHADINNNCAAINSAVEHENISMVKAIINAGADLTDRYTGNWKSLFIAVEKDREDIAQVLLTAKIKVDVRNENDSTPLIYAASKGSLKLIKLLIKNGANLNAQNNRRPLSDVGSNFIGTPLAHAIEFKQEAAAKLLRELGATK